MIETIATLITVFCGIFSMIITACTIRAPYSKTVANVLINNNKIVNNSLTKCSDGEIGRRFRLKL